MNCGVPCPYDHAGTACTKPAFHAGPCAWPTAIDMRSWLPFCRECGGILIECGHPAFGADGKSNAVEPKSTRSMVLRMTAGERILHSSCPEPNTGCWLWLNVPNHDGYALIKWRGITVHAHRLSYETFVGHIPPGMTIDHACRQRCCVNPSHLRTMSHFDNCKGNATSTALSGRTHCMRGHPFTPDNILHDPARGAARICRTCRRENSRASKLRARAALMLLRACALCGGDPKTCECPPFDARLDRVNALNAELQKLSQQRRDERYDAGLDRKRKRAPLPAVAVILDPATRPRRAARPWCPAHAWAQVEGCSMCVHARAAHAADERTET